MFPQTQSKFSQQSAKVRPNPSVKRTRNGMASPSIYHVLQQLRQVPQVQDDRNGREQNTLMASFDWPSKLVQSLHAVWNEKALVPS